MKKLSLLLTFVLLCSIGAIAQVKANKYTDAEIIKLSRYITELEKKDSLFKVMQLKLADAEREKSELQNSLADLKDRPASTTTTAAATPAAMAVANEKLAGYAKMLHFNLGSASIRPESVYILDGVADILKLTNAKFNIEGYTDITGSQELNMNLSKERAENVRAYLISKGIDASRLTANGFGQKSPIDSNETEEGRAKNRRVTITTIN
ncbi:MAG: OmpA family protein [Bacteroidetes bacterium]|nr:OmpA family protein [Bacteroidota bacterium]